MVFTEDGRYLIFTCSYLYEDYFSNLRSEEIFSNEKNDLNFSFNENDKKNVNQKEDESKMKEFRNNCLFDLTKVSNVSNKIYIKKLY